MKTKTHFHFFLTVIISSFILLLGCGKDDNEKKAALPDVTKEGRNTLGFLIDGNVWLPAYKCNFGGSNCGELEASYGLPLVPENSFTLNANRRLEKLSSFYVTVKAGASITGIGDKTDSINVVYTSEDWAGSTYPGKFIGPVSGSKFIITKLDKQAKIISGEFDLVLADSVNTTSRKTLSSGRFDFQFYTCKCSN